MMEKQRSRRKTRFPKKLCDRLYDLIVIGAGPGGSCAASAALQNGLQVLQIEGETFPRVKPCAGALTGKSWLPLGQSFGPQFRGMSEGFDFSDCGTNFQHFTHSRTFLKFVHRPEFDQFLVQQNLGSQSFTFLDSTRVSDVRWSGSFFLIETERGTLRSLQLVGADGAYSIVNRIFQLARPRGRATALELELPRDRRCECRAPRFDFGIVEKGYGWIFPKDRYWSVGLYSLADRTPGMRDRLRDYAKSNGFQWDSSFETTIHGHRYGVGGYRLRVPEFPLYLVGDAGGFAEATAGEGIYYAMESGRLAGDTAAAVHSGTASHRYFYRRLRKGVLADTFLSWHVSRIFYRDPAFWLHRLGWPVVWRPLVQGYAEGETIAFCLIKLLPLLNRSRGQASLTAH